MDISFRKATNKDVQTILDMEQTVSSQTYHAMVSTNDVIDKYISKDNAFLILDLSNKIVGFISYEHKGPSHAHINDLTILPQYQNQGIGSKAFEFILERLKDTRRIDLITHPKNTPALRLYLKYGFNIEAWKENYYGDGEARIVLAKIKSERR